MPSCQSTGVKLGPTAVSMCEWCMKGRREAAESRRRRATASTGVKLGPTAMTVCKWCMKGKDRGGGVAEEGSHDGNEIEALDESAMPFVPVHRAEARTDSDGVRAEVDEEEGWSRRSRGRGKP
ncbi:hypothetical protein Scep_025854 [Stephania cephalantha]|uniref:Uncharacterized protein n=1 Tax=Stephania cephalantha TaxID=152367 RepID=A0AAP0ELJ1_9MAGN